MRNLKKILALVLALMMTVSLMVVASAASYDDYSDKEQIDETYAEAVEVLAGIGIYQGDTEGTFRPQDTLTRAEVATLLYRLLTGDVTDSKVDTYAGYDEFTDVPSTEWYAGFVNYAYVKGWVIGNGDGTYGPNDNVTGVELATMLVRALGRDVNGEEIGGDDWELKASVLAAKADLNKNLPSVFMSKDATREQTAQMIFNALNAYTYGNWSSNYYEHDTTLGQETLMLDYTLSGIDQWGRPAKLWFANTGATKPEDFDHNYNSASDELYAAIEDEAVYTSTKPITECDLSTELGLIRKVSGIDVFLNGVNTDKNETITPTATKAVLGAQGRLMEVYDTDKDGDVDSIVYIDTFLAQVDKVVDATYDDAGHPETPAYLYLTIYDDRAEVASAYSAIRLSSTSDYSYTKGQMLLVNALGQEKGTYATCVNVYDTATGDSPLKQDNGYYIYDAADFDHGIYFLGEAEALVGAQSHVYDDNSRTVGDTKYPSNVQFNHDATVDPADGEPVVSTTNYTWYFDEEGNLIGSFAIQGTYSYGVIESIQWVHPQGSDGYAEATLRYMDGSTAKVKVNTMNGQTFAVSETPDATPPGYAVSDEISVNYLKFAGTGLMEITDKGDGSVDLLWVGKTGLNATGDRIGTNNVDITTGVSKIGSVSTNNDTVYLIGVKNEKTGKLTFSTVTGFDNVANFEDVTVDYADTNKDGYADYVYILGTAAAVESEALVYVKELTWFCDNDTKTYHLTDAYVADELTDVEVHEDVFNTIKANTLYWIKVTDGVVQAGGADDIDATGVVLGATGNEAQLVTVTSIGSGVLNDGSNEWNINSAEVYNGELADIEAGDTVAVVYPTGKLTVSAIYIFD